MTDLLPVAGSGHRVRFLDSILAIRADAARTGGQLGLSESWAARGHAAPLHRHTREDEAFYVIDGELRFRFADEPPFVRGPGELVWLPRGYQHSFVVTSPEARFLVVTTPAGFEEVFRTGTPTADLEVPPAGSATDEDVDRAMAVLVECGVELLGPPPAPETAGPDVHRPG